MSQRGEYGYDVPPGVADLRPDDFSEFDAKLAWIQDAFKITKGQIPRLLGIRRIDGIADFFQDGWPVSVPAWLTITTSASTTGFMASLLGQQTTGLGVAGVTFGVLLPTGLVVGKDVNLATAMVRILGFDVDHLGGAGAGVVRVRWKLGRNGDPSISPFPRFVNGSVVNGSFLDHAGFFGDKANLWIPPGWDWVIEFPTTVAAENYVVHVAAQFLPSGVKVQS